MCRKPTLRGFTLIELLVVIAIIIVLTSLTFQAIGDARRAAYRLRCAGNLRQIGVSLTYYQDDYNGFTMPADLGGDTRSWINHLAFEYGGGHDLFRCPRVEPDDGFNPYGGPALSQGGVARASYVMNSIAFGRWQGALLATDPERTCGYSNGTTNPVHDSRFTQPSRTIAIVDALPGLSSVDARGIVRFDETDHGFAGEHRDVGFHHAGGFNALMGDGRVEHMRRTLPDNWAAAEY